MSEPSEEPPLGSGATFFGPVCASTPNQALVGFVRRLMRDLDKEKE